MEVVVLLFMKSDMQNKSMAEKLSGPICDANGLVVIYLFSCCFFWVQLVYQWIVKPQVTSKVNGMFLPGRTAFVFDMVSFL